MNKFFTLFCAALLGSAAASATVTVTYNGKALENGETLSFYMDDMHEEVPGVISTLQVKPVVTVAGAATKCTTVSTSRSFNICTDQCYATSDFEAPFKITVPKDLEAGETELDIHYEMFAGEEPDQVETMTVNLDQAGEVFSFTISLDINAGVGNVLVDKSGVYEVYNVSGVKVLSTTDAAAVNTLAPGLYIVNGKKHLVR